ncbi:unnamed protein product, partial [Notodromas monacha]
IDNRNDDESTPLHLAAKFGRTRVVKELISRNRNVVTDEDENGDTALHIACSAGHDRAGKLILEAGADVEARNGKQWTPLDCAARNGHRKCVDILLQADAPLDPVDKRRTTPLQLAARQGHHAVVHQLLRAGADLAARDSNGMNAFELAVIHNQRQVAETIVESDEWRQALMNERRSPRTGSRITPLRMLIRKFPDVAEKVFNRCVKTNGRGPEDRHFSITFLYEFIDDTYMASPWKSPTASTVRLDGDGDGDDDELLPPLILPHHHAPHSFGDDHKLKPGVRPYDDNAHEIRSNHPLSLMCKFKRTRLLSHPLTKALLRQKWQQFGRYLYYMNLVFYLAFLGLLTGYIASTPGPKPVEPVEKEAALPFPPKTENFKYNCRKLASDENISKQNQFAHAAKMALFLLAALHLVKEVFQIYQARFWRYFTLENLLEWVCYVTALGLVIDFTECSESTGLREPWQWAVGAVSIFLGWINLLLFIKKFPYFGIYVIMFTDIFTTFSKFFLVFVLFVVAFGLGFYTLLQQQAR